VEIEKGNQHDPEFLPLNANNRVRVDRYERETAPAVRVLDEALAKRPDLVGDRYSIADVTTWPWTNALPKLGVALDGARL
jgi:glutathione S-transferase